MYRRARRDGYSVYGIRRVGGAGEVSWLGLEKEEKWKGEEKKKTLPETPNSTL